MRSEEFEKLRDKYCEKIQAALALDAWSVKIEDRIRSPEDDQVAEMLSAAEYRCSWLHYEPDYIVDEAEFLTITRHEYLHLVVAPYLLAFELVKTMIPEAQHETVSEAFRQAGELAITNVENIFDRGLGLPVLEMLDLAENDNEVGRQTAECES